MHANKAKNKSTSTLLESGWIPLPLLESVQEKAAFLLVNGNIRKLAREKYVVCRSDYPNLSKEGYNNIIDWKAVNSTVLVIPQDAMLQGYQLNRFAWPVW